MRTSWDPSEAVTSLWNAMSAASRRSATSRRTNVGFMSGVRSSDLLARRADLRRVSELRRPGVRAPRRHGIPVLLWAVATQPAEPGAVVGFEDAAVTGGGVPGGRRFTAIRPCPCRAVPGRDGKATRCRRMSGSRPVSPRRPGPAVAWASGSASRAAGWNGEPHCGERGGNPLAPPLRYCPLHGPDVRLDPALREHLGDDDRVALRGRRRTARRPQGAGATFST